MSKHRVKPWGLPACNINVFLIFIELFIDSGPGEQCWQITLKYLGAGFKWTNVSCTGKYTKIDDDDYYKPL